MNAADPLIGITLSDTYAITRLIAEGGMGRVYEAKHTRLPGRRYAVKVVRAELASDDIVLARFRREVEAIAAIAHPNVMAIHDVDRVADGRPFYVAEYLDGVDLWQVLKDHGKLEVQLAAQLAISVCLGLEAAHARGVIHRDIKPENIFILGSLDQPELKVVDFGISQVVNRDERALTKTGLIIGTPGYMAPEQIEAKTVDARTDLYATGALLYRMLTGAEPFKEVDATATLFAVLAREPVAPSQLEPSIPRHLEAVIQKAMAKNPAERFESLAALRAELAVYAQPAGTESGLDAPTVVSQAGEATALGARPALVGYLAAAGGASLLMTAQAAEAGLRMYGGTAMQGVPGTQALLASLAIAAAAAFPAWLGYRELRTKVWPNTARVLALVEQLRGPVLVGLGCYALLGCLIAATETLLLRDPRGLMWPGWPLLMLASTAVAVALARRHRPAEGAATPGKAARPFARTLAAAAALALVVGLGVGLRTPVAESMPAGLSDSAGPGEAGPGQVALADAATSTGVVGRNRPGRGSTSTAGAGDAVAVAEATSGAGSESEGESDSGPDLSGIDLSSDAGRSELVALVELHPENADLLEKLSLVYADDPAQFDAFAAHLARLVALRPEVRSQQRFITPVVEAVHTRTPKRHSERAIAMLAHELGPDGIDALYAVVTKRKSLQRRIDAALHDPATVAGASPALAIALELRATTDCGRTVALLERAEAVGDERALLILEARITGRRRGCGFLGLRRCRARCAREATEIRAAITKIESRLSPGAQPTE